MHTLLNGLRDGVRLLLKNPTFTLIAGLTFALGIAVNTAIFTVEYMQGQPMTFHYFSMIGIQPLLGSGLPIERPGRGANFEVEGLGPSPDGVFAYLRAVGPDYFQSPGVPIVKGRPLTAADRAGAPLVAVVNEAFAKHFLNYDNPVGAHIRFGGKITQAPWFTVVGIAADVHGKGQTQDVPLQIYFPAAQRQHPPAAPKNLMLRAALEPLLLLS